MRNKQTDIYAYAKQMAKQWMRKNKYSDEDDVWDTYNTKDINPLNMMDVNLWVGDNLLVVTAYPLVYQDDHLVIDTDKMHTVYHCPWYPKQRTKSRPCKTSYTTRRNK